MPSAVHALRSRAGNTRQNGKERRSNFASRKDKDLLQPPLARRMGEIQSALAASHTLRVSNA